MRGLAWFVWPSGTGGKVSGEVQRGLPSSPVPLQDGQVMRTTGTYVDPAIGVALWLMSFAFVAVV